MKQLPCFCCGLCCKNYQPWVNLEEADTIAAQLGITREKLISNYTDHRWPGTQSFLMKHVEGSCVFLEYHADKKKYLCRIHDFKPGACRAWKSGVYHRECQEGLRRIWELNVEPSGRITGTPEKVAECEEFLKTCDL